MQCTEQNLGQQSSPGNALEGARVGQQRIPISTVAALRIYGLCVVGRRALSESLN